jgi:hypothetical protein
MRSWFLAVAALLGIASVAAHADYIIILVDLSASKPEEEFTPVVPQGRAMQAPTPGMGFKGGGAGMPQGAPGMPGMTGAGFRGGQAPGMTGFDAPGAGMGVGGQMRGSPGAAPNIPPGLDGMTDTSGILGQFTSRRAGEEQEDETETNPMILRAIIEVDHSQVHRVIDALRRDTGRVQIEHKWGKTITYYRPGEILVLRNRMSTVAERYAAHKSAIKTDDPDRVEKLIKLARWSLAHGILDKVEDVMEEVEKLDPKNQFAVTFTKIQAALNRDVVGEEPGMGWRDRLGDFSSSSSKHYILISDVKTSKESQSRLETLEKNMKGFYYWFALRGKVLPVPRHRLIVCLESNPNSLQRHRKDIFDNTEMVADGFYVPRDNLTILSNKRLDEGYAALEKSAEPYFSAWNEEELFAKHTPRKRQYSPNETARAETFALLLRALREEADRATISHDGTQQLIVASHLLPRAVVPPAWVDFGLPSFFETPRGACWPGFGESHVVYHTNFKHWLRNKSKNLDPDAAATLHAVITDQYFREAEQGKFKEPKDKRMALARARTTAWALAFYLANNKLDGLLRYYQELSTLPRDLPPDPTTMEMLFARALNLTDESNPDQIDPNKFANFASNWYQFVDLTPLEFEEKERDTAPKKSEGGKSGNY